MTGPIPGPMTIRLNSGEVVTRPYREAVGLLSRRLADYVGDDETVVSLGEPQVEVTATTRTLEDLTKPELVERAKERDLPVYGTKDDLIERLNAEDDQLSATTVEDDLDDLVGAPPEDVPGEDSDDSDGGR